jgi:hypothetical protein
VFSLAQRYTLFCDVCAGKQLLSFGFKPVCSKDVTNYLPTLALTLRERERERGREDSVSVSVGVCTDILPVSSFITQCVLKHKETLAFKRDEAKLLHNIIPTHILYGLQGKHFEYLEYSPL